MQYHIPTTVTEVHMIYQNKVKAAERPQITCSLDAYEILHANWSDQIGLLEEFYILLLDRANRVMGRYLVSQGGMAGTVVDAKIIFACALKCRASSIILAHNHPSCNLYPSQPDKDLTRKLTQGGEVLDILVLDHLILSPEGGYFSFADEGLLQPRFSSSFFTFQCIIMNLIDHSEAIQAIKDCYAPRYDIHPQAISEAAALWGGQPNASGVFSARPEQLVNVGQCRGEIQFYETSKGFWLTGIDVSCSFKGWSYAPSVWNPIGYHSYIDARLAGIAQLINCFEGIARDSSSMNSETNRRHARKVVKQLQAARTPQLTLFAP